MSGGLSLSQRDTAHQGNALGNRPRCSPRSEGTPHFPEWRMCAQSTPMQRSFRTHELHPTHTQGVALSLIHGSVGARKLAA